MPDMRARRYRSIPHRTRRPERNRVCRAANRATDAVRGDDGRIPIALATTSASAVLRDEAIMQSASRGSPSVLRLSLRGCCEREKERARGKSPAGIRHMGFRGADARNEHFLRTF